MPHPHSTQVPVHAVAWGSVVEAMATDSLNPRPLHLSPGRIES